jgi:hypothetical protein
MLDYLEVLESGSNAGRLKDVKRNGMALRWFGGAEIVWGVASDGRKICAAGVFLKWALVYLR